MPRPRRSVKRTPLIESSDSDSENEEPVKKAKLTPQKTDARENESSSSESDIEKYMQPVDKINLSSTFFNTKKPDEFEKIEKNIFEGVRRLSDSDSDEEDEEKKCTEPVLNANQENKEPIFNFQQLENFTKKIEEAKAHVEKYNTNQKDTEKDLDISNLLKVGEGKQLNLENIKEEDLHSSDFETTDDDWEEVEVKDGTQEKALVPQKNIEITVGGMPDHVKKKKGVDLLTAMKRRLNRIRKENQVYVHKVHLLCWIAHGNYVNSVINDPDILSKALSLIPSNSYPSDRPDLGYLEKIVQWYKKTIKLSDKSTSFNLTLINSLKFQIKQKQANSKEAFVLIFIAILRALGLQCRLVLSFQVEPLRPPSNELHSLSTKEKPDKNITNSKASSSKSKTSDEIKDKKNVSATTSKPNLKSLKPESSALNKEKNKSKTNVSKDKLTEKKNDKTPAGASVEDNSKKKVSTSTTKPNLKSLKSDTNKNNKEKVDLKNRAKGKDKLNEEKDDNNVKERRKSTRNINKSEQTTSKTIPQNTIKSDKQIKSDTSDKNKLSIPKKRLKSSSPSSETKSTLSVEENKSRSKSVSSASTKSKNLDVKNTGTRSKSVSTTKEEPKRKTKSIIKIKLTKYSVTRNSEDKEIPQLDGNNDESPKKITSKNKIDLKKLRNIPSGKECPANKRKRITSSFKKEDSEDDFSPSPTKKSPTKEIQTSKCSIDVKSDIINLIKGRISEQKTLDKRKLVNKKKTQDFDSDSDSDYMPEPVQKKKHDSDSDVEYFVPKPKVKKRIKVKKENGKLKVLSDDDEKKKKKGTDVWVEVFLESEEKWISVDVNRGQVHCVNELFMRASHPVNYVVAWNNDNTLKDVSKRYCKNFNTVTRKLRIDVKWWDETLKPFLEKNTPRSQEEDNDLARQQLDQPLPTTISEYKNHPLYALKRHILKFEAIYPPDIVPLGYVRGEPVYPRNSVYVCKSREIWVKDARVVKPGEQPYKIVKARPKYDRLSNKMITGQMLELFGIWQTKDYEPPTAENGIVPRNPYGNVELFKPCMLPKGTVHLKLPGLNKVCKKLNIDCASAVVGFDFHGGYSHAVIDGFVVCKEYEDTCVAAWEQEQEEIEKKENEKIEKRVYTNWKKLIKGLLIRERLKARYDFGGETSTGGTTKKSSKSIKFATKKRRLPIEDSDSD